MRLSWGTKLFIGAAFFIIFIVSMVTWMMRQRIDLVDENYYEQSLNYESELKKYKNTKGLYLEIKHNDSLEQVEFRSAMGGQQNGFAFFYKPDNPSYDFVKSFVMNESGYSVLSTKGLAKGRWKVTFEWIVGTDTLAASKEFFKQ